MGGLVSKILGISLLVVSEVEQDIKDGKITVGELLDLTKDILQKLDYLDKPLVKLKSGK